MAMLWGEWRGEGQPAALYWCTGWRGRSQTVCCAPPPPFPRSFKRTFSYDSAKKIRSICLWMNYRGPYREADSQAWRGHAGAWVSTTCAISVGELPSLLRPGGDRKAAAAVPPLPSLLTRFRVTVPCGFLNWERRRKLAATIMARMFTSPPGSFWKWTREYDNVCLVSLS